MGFEPLRVMVLTPAETLLDVTEVEWVQVQLADGCGIGVYPGHAPLLAETVTAPIRYALKASGEHTLDLEAGILQISEEGVTILTSGSPQPDEDSLPCSVDSARFDRLARELLSRLKTWPENVLVDEEEG
ncbi:MAG: hypothetical protein DRI48_00025 [Chloroflexi bacterium]|nr:MAG: hypothetical protein DRI48_00025 [Chloroflexota bacterium]